MTTPVPKPADQARIVASLAKESRQPAADVKTLYEHERAELASGAHVTKFLDIFAIRRVQAILRERDAESRAAPAESSPQGPCSHRRPSVGIGS